MHGQGKIRIGFLVVLAEQGMLSYRGEKGLGGYPYIPSMVIKRQMLKDPSSFPPFATLISPAHSFSPHLPGKKGLLAHWYTEMKGKERIFMFTTKIALKT